jgi:hypothetical protein
LGDATEQRPKEQNGLNRRKYASTRLRCCGMTSREQFTPDIPRILL